MKLSKLLTTYIFYAALLTSWLVVQPSLKEMPQVVVLIISGVMIGFGYYQNRIAFNAFELILMFILMFTFSFRVIDLIFDWLNPRRGWIEENGEFHRVMDVSGILIGFVSFIIAVIFGFTAVKWRGEKSIHPAYHLAIATFISTGLVFLIFELF